MRLTFDLHTHSAFAGGARPSKLTEKYLLKRFYELARFSPLKGISVLGLGDIQFKPWRDFVLGHVSETNNGLYEFEVEGTTPEKVSDEVEQPKYVLQTEVIFTCPIPNRGKKKSHLIILFPDLVTVDGLLTLFERWGVNHEKMARPFIVCSSNREVSERIHAILDLDKLIEVIPAHIMTPEGVFGGSHRINYGKDFFGDSWNRISVVETGLSADPPILEMIPELERFTFISNADAHSSALNRVGREFTTIVPQNLNYENIITSLRQNKVLMTGEFHPSEGRYFLTGHREERKAPYQHNKGQFCYYSPKFLPENGVCPICKKQLTVGVLERAYEISKVQSEGLFDGSRFSSKKKRSYVTIVPLIEVIAASLGIKSISSKKVQRLYFEIVSQVGSEVQLWEEPNIEDKLDVQDNSIIQSIKEIKNRNFCFEPPGYDGVYGELRIGVTQDFTNLKVEKF